LNAGLRLSSKSTATGLCTYPIKVSLGTRASLEDPAGLARRSLANLSLDAAPCKRYYINAQFNNPIQQVSASYRLR
jgi:hypothetical protein